MVNKISFIFWLLCEVIMELCMRTEYLDDDEHRHAACNRSPQEDCDGHVPKAADRSLAKLFLRRGYKLTGGTCST